MNELCDRIAEFRTTLGITQTTLAMRLGVTRSAVNAWEMGISTPQLKHVIAMAAIFHTTVDGMLGVDDKTVIDISMLSNQEQETVLKMIDCLRSKN